MRLVDQCDPTTRTGLRDRALIVLLYRTGLRCAEALDLKPSDINYTHATVTVLSGKGGKRRVVGIDRKALDEIREWADARAKLGYPPGTPLFCTKRGTRIYGGQVRSRLKVLQKQAGITTRVHAHGFRHTHARELLAEGVPIYAIQKQLGHTRLHTTAIYLNHAVDGADPVPVISRRAW